MAAEAGQPGTPAHVDVPAGPQLTVRFSADQATVVAATVKIDVQRPSRGIEHACDVIPTSDVDRCLAVSGQQSTRRIGDLETYRAQPLINCQIQLVPKFASGQARDNCGVVGRERRRVNPSAQRHSAGEP